MNPYAHLRQRIGRPLFVPFTVLGDPNKETSLSIVNTLIESGADALELGLPFSDPPADGPIIQAADKRALGAGIRVDDCFDIIRSVRGKFPISHSPSTIPIGLLVYFNLVLQRGIQKFYADCRDAGVNSVLVADLPLEHAGEILDAAQRNNVAPVFLVSEVTSDERLKEIANIAGGYLYLVSYLGVTGVKDAVLEQSVRVLIQRCRKQTDLPLIVGFGISTAMHVAAAVRAGADGVIVGSRIVKEVPDVQAIARVCRELQVPLKATGGRQ